MKPTVTAVICQSDLVSHEDGFIVKCPGGHLSIQPDGSIGVRPDGTEIGYWEKCYKVGDKVVWVDPNGHYPTNAYAALVVGL